jgi:hypothetical protein
MKPADEPIAPVENKVAEQENAAPVSKERSESIVEEIKVVPDSAWLADNQNTTKALEQIVLLCKLSSGDATQLKNTIIKVQGLAEKALKA